ncbi:hypothetical protein ANN_21094 [Periplaneta americana]|uniref:Uncharacterized protein n=1 Tax=Periplaneta americana TaxID=6978 RepID=A0ABQ8SEI7_PERAM|nr:hypothetical protein ANN_21094 [Periplaneta americana]
MTNDKDTVISMGDLNCRVDAPTQKMETVVNHIEKEDLILINDRKEKTYLVFTNSNKTYQEIRNLPVRKHIPVSIYIYVRDAHQGKTPNKQTTRLSREIDKDKISTEETRIVSQEIKEGRIDEALSKLEKHTKQAIVRKERKKRTAKP